MQSLSAFLSSIGLEQYHAAFIKAGATDQDLAQLVAFNQTELAEFLSALDMLPFHSIKFKKCLRALQPPSSSVTQDIVSPLLFFFHYIFFLKKNSHRQTCLLLMNLLYLTPQFMAKKRAVP